jgi:hypothetical protein
MDAELKVGSLESRTKEQGSREAERSTGSVDMLLTHIHRTRTTRPKQSR